MEQKGEHRNEPTQIYATDFNKDAKKFNGEKTTFSKNGGGATKHSQGKYTQSKTYILYKD